MKLLKSKHTMMVMKRPQHIMGVFQKGIEEEFAKYCEDFQIESSVKSFLIFIIDQDLISPAIMKRYVILYEFEKLYPLHKFHKTQTVFTISNKLNISERTIWSALKYKMEKYKKSRGKRK
ncbi:MAG: hypothetical protein AAF487_11550 [Bacteroidota bacterium]